MKKRALFASFIFIFATVFGDTVVVESDNVADVLKHVDDETLVLFDLDGVVFEPQQMLGCDRWAYYEGDKYIDACDGDVKKGMLEFEPVWTAVQKKVSVKIVDENLTEVLETLRKRGNKIMGFTARGINLIDRTQEQLASIDIDFSGDSVCEKNSGDCYTYENGILYTWVGGRKGDVLKSFFDEAGFSPSKIVFIDDRNKNIQTVQEMCEAQEISYVGIRYGGADETAARFIPEIGDVQLYCFNAFDTILSDEAAAEMFCFFGELFGNIKCYKHKCYKHERKNL